MSQIKDEEGGKNDGHCSMKRIKVDDEKNLTGELMRLCINNLATGDTASCYQTCNFVRDMYTQFLGCTNTSNRLLNRKLCTLEQNLHKIESVCYTIKVRGSEIPKHILMDLVGEEHEDIDESNHTY